MKILILNGPNLNLLGTREPNIYGSETLDDIIRRVDWSFRDVTISHYQSNHEGALVDRIQELLTKPVDGLVVNFGAFTHYSYALHDALRMLTIPKVEVHISHIYKREAFRHQSVTAPACDGMITGLVTHGYHLAVQWLVQQLS